ncbi:DUF1476 domain-containing protein [Paramagnetospirillum kuznetsovii]|uniref:DUF1476 domain-containing protein n=1 Tax=Paramagnetospirillum kuznetsovii TaxID=2053833 RepID=A0A364NW71_9PROT|nr:DUF1476 domain-containing protein [Paramagnetospirillum kuznetsovii]RAU21302.1 DUF1476 domain-containing protein [Paramagnetospirillum kuznetsovii]
MNAFDDREKAFEAKYHLDQEMEFKANIRRDKLLGLWAAEKMGIGGDAAKTYALSVVDVEFNGTDHDAGQKVARDFAASGVAIDEGTIRHQMTVLLLLAHEQIIEELSR